MPQHIDPLLAAGLSPREARVYAALLQGDASATTIAQQVSLPQAKVYGVLAQLRTKGLITTLSGARGKVYRAHSPNRIVALLRNSLEAAERLKDKRPAKVEISLVEGRDAVLSALRDAWEGAPQDIVGYVFALPADAKDPVLDIALANLTAKRAASARQTYVLRSLEEQEPSHTRLSVRYTSAPYPAGITVLGDLVLDLSWSEHPSLILVRDMSRAVRLRTLFHALAQ